MNAEPAALLHNMSAPPKTVVQFDGLRALHGLAPTRSQPPLHGVAVRFRIDAQLLRLAPAGLLRAVEPGSRVRLHRCAEARLLQLVEQRAQQLPLPDGCLLLQASDAHVVAWSDLLTALAVLAKCTDTVWLRAKVASLEVARARGDVSLLVPPAFKDRIPVPPAPETAHG